MSENVLFAGNLGALTGVKHAFFCRAIGKSWFAKPEGWRDASVDCGRVALFLGVPKERVVGVCQRHEANVISVKEPWVPDNMPDADALVTDQHRMALVILTADCVPVLLADESAGVIGAAHAGWRSAIGGVLENTLEAMEKLGAKRKSIQAAIGPCIWQRSYEVGSEFPAPFLAESSDNEKYFSISTKAGHYHFDLAGYVLGKLQGLGVASVEPSLADTCADPERFFSHRFVSLHGLPQEGRLVSAVVLS